MKTAFLIDIGDGHELDKLKDALTLMGYPPQVVSRFGILLGNDDGTEEDVSLPSSPRRRGRVAEAQEVEVSVRGVETVFNNPDQRRQTQRGESYVIASGRPTLNITLELEAPLDDQKILSLLQRVQRSGIIGLRNVER